MSLRVNIEINSEFGLSATERAVLQALGNFSDQEYSVAPQAPMAAEETPAPVRKAPAKKAPAKKAEPEPAAEPEQEPEQEAAEEKAAPAKKAPAKKAPAKKAEPEPAAEPEQEPEAEEAAEDDGPAVLEDDADVAELRQQAVSLATSRVSNGSSAEVKEALGVVGAARVGLIPDDRLAEFIKALG